MDRIIFGEDHHAFRASAKEYCDRSLVPRMEQFLEEKTIERAAWLEAGKQGFLGLDVPEEYGGSSRRRLPVQRGVRRGGLEGLRVAVELLRHPLRLRRAVPGRPRHRGAEAALAAEVLLR